MLEFVCLSQLLQLRLEEEEEEEEEKEKEEEVELVVRLERHEDPRAEQVGGSGLQDDKKTVKPVIIELTMKYKYFPNFGDCRKKGKHH